jgi:hypothetical protein
MPSFTDSSAAARLSPSGETGVQSSRSHLPLLIEGELLSQEQDFRAEGRARAEHETEEKKSICDQIGDQLKQRIQ